MPQYIFTNPDPTTVPLLTEARKIRGAERGRSHVFCVPATPGGRVLTSSVSLLRLMPRSALRLFYSRSPTIGFATALLFQRRGFDEAYLKSDRLSNGDTHCTTPSRQFQTVLDPPRSNKVTSECGKHCRNAIIACI